MRLRIPPKYPKAGDLWEREDGVVFIYVDNEKGWIRK